ncbi:MAG: hypothetical protein JWN40_3848 [Phycisphaerales bacterium]|nr:hypothetical protein [Phycisphaerales bacterium]
MLHSVIIAYRNRVENLRVLLDCFTNCVEWGLVEIVIVDLNSGYQSAVLIDTYRDRLNLRHHLLPYSGTFHKTMALNYGIAQAQGGIITIHDVDILPPPDFFTNIHSFFANPANHQKKLARDVNLLDTHQTAQVLAQTYEQYSQWLFTLDAANKAAMTYNGKVLGCSQISMPKENFTKVGGYDEGFVGYGFEDYEFNLRCHNLYGDAVVQGSLWHLYHSREADWQNSEAMRATTERFQAAEQNGFTSLLPISA